jgi:hypothetical protein
LFSTSDVVNPQKSLSCHVMPRVILASCNSSTWFPNTGFYSDHFFFFIYLLTTSLSAVILQFSSIWELQTLVFKNLWHLWDSKKFLGSLHSCNQHKTVLVVDSIVSSRIWVKANNTTV